MADDRNDTGSTAAGDLGSGDLGDTAPEPLRAGPPGPEPHPEPRPEPLRCAGAVIIDDTGRVFVQRRAPTRPLFPNCWDIVGGHLEADETFDEAMRREVTEETGWLVSHVLADLGEITYTDEAGVTRIERDYLVRVEGDLARPVLAPEEHTEWRWIERSEVDVVNERRGIGDTLTQRLLIAGFDAATEIGIYDRPGGERPDGARAG